MNCPKLKDKVIKVRDMSWNNNEVTVEFCKGNSMGKGCRYWNNEKGCIA